MIGKKVQVNENIKQNSLEMKKLKEVRPQYLKKNEGGGRYLDSSWVNFSKVKINLNSINF